MCRRSVVAYFTRLPHDAAAGSVAGKLDEPVFLAVVELVNGVVEAFLDVDAGSRRQRIMNVWRPTFLLERFQDDLLIVGGNLELFHNGVPQEQGALHAVVARDAGGAAFAVALAGQEKS